MLKRDRELMKEIANKLSTYREIVRIIAYGSRVRGNNRDDSDFDILIIVNKKDGVIKGKIIDIIYDYELDTGISFSIKIYSEEELRINEGLGSPFIKSIKEEGIIFYDAEQKRKRDTCKVSP